MPHIQRQDGCQYDHWTANGWRLTFSWWTHLLPVTDGTHLKGVWPLNASGRHGSPDVVYLSTGIHEAHATIWSGNENVSVYRDAVLAGVRELLSAARRGPTRRRGAEVMLLLNGLCYGTQAVHVGQQGYPTPAITRRIAEGNRLLRAEAARHGLPVLDRSVSMLVPKLRESPCFHHHPYGIMSELHVRIAFQSLLC